LASGVSGLVFKAFHFWVVEGADFHWLSFFGRFFQGPASTFIDFQPLPIRFTMIFPWFSIRLI